MFDNRTLKETFGLRWDEGTGEWRRIHNIEHYDLYSSPHMFRFIKSIRMKLAGHVARMCGRVACRVLLGGSEGERQLGRYRHGWECNIKMDLQDCGNEPSGSI